MIDDSHYFSLKDEWINLATYPDDYMTFSVATIQHSMLCDHHDFPLLFMSACVLFTLDTYNKAGWLKWPTVWYGHSKTTETVPESTYLNRYSNKMCFKGPYLQAAYMYKRDTYTHKHKHILT